MLSPFADDFAICAFEGFLKVVDNLRKRKGRKGLDHYSWYMIVYLHMLSTEEVMGNDGGTLSAHLE